MSLTRDDYRCFYPASILSDTVLDKWLLIMQRAIEAELFKFGVNDYVEDHWGDGSCYLFTDVWPIAEITEITICDSPIDLVEDIEVDLEQGCIKRVCKNWPKTYGHGFSLVCEYAEGCHPNIQITYRAGFDPCPPELAYAAYTDIAANSCRIPGVPGNLIWESTPGNHSKRWTGSSDRERNPSGLLSAVTMEIIDCIIGGRENLY